MRTLIPDPALVMGTAVVRVSRVRLAAGTWDIDMVLGVMPAVSTATLLVRPIGGATSLTFASSAAPARLASQRVVLASPTELEFVLSNSSSRLGIAVVEDIRISRAPMQLWTNGISVGLNTQILIGDTTIALAPGAGALIGLSPTGGQFFMATIYSPPGFEVVRCTARATDTLTVTRGQEGTAAAGWPITASIIIAATAASLTSIQDGL